MRQDCDALIQSAKLVLEKPIIRRAQKLADVGQNRTWLDTRARFLEDEIRQQFAFAMSDFAATRVLADELPLLAAAYRLSGDMTFRDRVTQQLSEMATWSPLQRPGWSLFAPGNRLPRDGKDGNWLATGCGVRAISVSLNLMPEESLDAALVQRLRTQLGQEILSVVDDWKTKRSWFIRTKNPVSNQWVLPTEGLIEACLLLGVERHCEAYELGVTNLLMALDSHGRQGEFEEGYGYASFTVTALMHAAQAMAVAGDRRAMDHPFLKNFPTWLVHHLQPGDMTINCFDAGPAYGAAERMRPLVSLLAAYLDSPVANWALANQVAGPSTDVPGILARAHLCGDTSKPPALFAYYERATRVNWRSSWRHDATGVWVRGGHPLDQHDHQDRGHVNFIWRGRPILIEAGTPDYGNSLMRVEYSSGVGHNVLQLGTAFPDDPRQPGKAFPLPGWQKRGAIAPITVRRLVAGGGDIAVSCKSGYENLARWERRVQWRANRMTVNDEVILATGKSDIILFRWHLGTPASAAITGKDRRCEVKWPEAEMILKADAPLEVTQVSLPDNTLAGHTGFEDAGKNHTCIVVRTREPQTALALISQIRPRSGF